MKFRTKLIIVITLLIALTFGIGGTVLINASLTAALDESEAAARRSFEAARSTLYLLNDMGSKFDYDGLADALGQMSEQEVGQWSALTLTSEGETIYHSGVEQLVRYAMPSAGPDRCACMPVGDEFGRGLILASSITGGDEELTLTARFDQTAVYAARETQERLYLAIYIAVVSLGLLTAVILAHVMTARLRHLASAVEQIAAGDMTIRSSLGSDDEFGSLSRDFDDMADQLQEHITRMEEDIRRKETFIGAFAHELKTPMTSIIGYADLLRQGGLDEASRMLAADYIFSEGQRLERLGFKLLEMQLLKNETPEMKDVNLKSLLSSVYTLMAPALDGRGIKLECTGEDTTFPMEPDLIRSLIYNLIDNGAKAIENRGTITVTAKTEVDTCLITVADTGRGMEPAELDRITEAFYRIDKSRSRAQGGAGLGLSLCSEIVKAHGGSLTFESEVGAGTVVKAVLCRKDYDQIGDRRVEIGDYY